MTKFPLSLAAVGIVLSATSANAECTSMTSHIIADDRQAAVSGRIAHQTSVTDVIVRAKTFFDKDSDITVEEYDPSSGTLVAFEEYYENPLKRGFYAIDARNDDGTTNVIYSFETYSGGRAKDKDIRSFFCELDKAIRSGT